MAGRPKKSDKEKLISVGLSISPKHETELKQIAGKEHREKGFITRAFYLRGLKAYRQDGLLFEPVPEPQAKRPPIRTDVRQESTEGTGSSRRNKHK